ncbi:uncharacterized protein VTP21DRAFT_5253 [Calcarisporiella thermophila]|uniref:uncharacterized protein n=1 Tax=Calcarisporiella thermophila TaxID=911321 RepID=UPI0037442B59
MKATFLTATVVLALLQVAVACRCKVGTPQGQYCGAHPAVIEGWVRTHVYECNPRGGCHDYGYRKSCDQCNALSC